MRGTILSYFTVGGFGHLLDDHKDEYCFYASDIKIKSGIVKAGDTVSFDLYRGHGLRAVNLRSSL